MSDNLGIVSFHRMQACPTSTLHAGSVESTREWEKAVENILQWWRQRTPPSPHITCEIADLYTIIESIPHKSVRRYHSPALWSQEWFSILDDSRHKNIYPTAVSAHIRMIERILDIVRCWYYQQSLWRSFKVEYWNSEVKILWTVFRKIENLRHRWSYDGLIYQYYSISNQSNGFGQWVWIYIINI